jgi:hypothetical protein
MDPKLIKTSLSLIREVYSDILDASYKIIIPAAIESVDTTKDVYDQAKRDQYRLKREPTPWGYTIYHNQPLRFRPVDVPNSIQLQVDVYGDVRWADDDMPVRQEIKVRIWCLHDNTTFREDYDSEEIFYELEDETKPYYPRPQKRSRVVSRFHFDRANPKQRGPQHHLQFGGIPESYELCWHPEKVNLPRLEYQPMDLFLTCHMIAANFFNQEYIEIRKRREWRQQTLLCQNWFVKEYYRQCFETVNNKQILLDRLWGVN